MSQQLNLTEYGFGSVAQKGSEPGDSDDDYPNQKNWINRTLKWLIENQVHPYAVCHGVNGK